MGGGGGSWVGSREDFPGGNSVLIGSGSRGPAAASCCTDILGLLIDRRAAIPGFVSLPPATSLQGLAAARRSARMRPRPTWVRAWAQRPLYPARARRAVRRPSASSRAALLRSADSPQPTRRPRACWRSGYIPFPLLMQCACFCSRRVTEGGGEDDGQAVFRGRG